MAPAVIQTVCLQVLLADPGHHLLPIDRYKENAKAQNWLRKAVLAHCKRMLGGSVAQGSLDLLADISIDSKALSGVDMETTAPQCLASAGAISNDNHTVQLEFGSLTLTPEHIVAFGATLACVSSTSVPSTPHGSFERLISTPTAALSSP